jgi:hypothetical protein
VARVKGEHWVVDERNKSLATYLRDHYAGGVGALQLLERLIKAHENTGLGRFFEELCREVKVDHEQLHHIMAALGIEESAIRDAAAWISEKFTRPKLGLASQTEGLALLQALEALSMGIGGKQMLWRGLDVIRDKSAVLQRLDFQRLEMRAVQQLQSVDAKRMEIVPQALGTEEHA